MSFALVTHAVIFIPPLLIAVLVLVFERRAFLEGLGAAVAVLRYPWRRLRTQEVCD